MYPVNIIGIGQSIDDLTSTHLELIKDCHILIGGARQLEWFDSPDKETITIKNNISSIVESIKEKMSGYKIVVLASGDPLFYGIGSTLIRHLEPSQINIHSNISSISAAFAAIKEPWHDAKVISMHGREKNSFIFSRLSTENKIALLTDARMDPKAIAAGLINEGIHSFRLCVLENLGDKDTEKITWFENLDQLETQTFASPNVVILKKKVEEKDILSHETHMGMDDSLFKHSKGLITKSEIRSISLSKLKLIKKDHVLWDIGSGSGSMGIEAALQIPWGNVYAIEKNSSRISDIIHNVKNFNCSNVQILNADFPKGVDDLKTPDRIFIGGGGEGLEQIIETSCIKLAKFGVIVINTVLIQNLEIALSLLKEYNFNPSVVQVQVSRSKAMPYGDRLEALNPVWIISGSKP